MQSNPHYIENTGTTDLVFLEMFRSANYEDISLGEWMAHTPHQLIDQHLHVGMPMIDAIPKGEMVVTPV
jgi:oxalate decarboxylase